MQNGTASGLQIAFLSFAVILLAVPLSNFVGAAFGASEADAGIVGRAAPFVLAAVIVCLFPPLRRQVAAELGRPVPPDRRLEVGLVALAKIPMFVGASGAFALWIWLSQGASVLEQRVSPVQVDRGFTIHSVLYFFVLGAVVGPVVEELVFRGFLYRAWERRWGWIPSALMVSALFGLYHPHFFNAFASSLLFIGVLRRTGSLWAPIAVHSFSNAMLWPPFAGQLLAPSSPAIGDISSWGLQLSCLFFAVIAFPAYLLVAGREDRRFAAEGPG